MVMDAFIYVCMGIRCLVVLFFLLSFALYKDVSK